MTTPSPESLATATRLSPCSYDGRCLTLSRPENSMCSECRRAEKIARAIDKAREEGLRSCLLHRCTKHHSVGQLNSTEASGAECGVCVKASQDEQWRESTTLMMNDWRAARKVDDNKTRALVEAAKRIDDVFRVGCGSEATVEEILALRTALAGMKEPTDGDG